MTIGPRCTGSTAHWAIEKIGEKVKKEGWKIKAIATSVRSEEQALALGIPILNFSTIQTIDVTIDGADEVDGCLQLIKGEEAPAFGRKFLATIVARMTRCGR
jgi:ribose 5-phosphate isomerase A